MKISNVFEIILLAGVIGLTMTACDNLSGNGDGSSLIGSPVTFTFSGLSNNDIYLVKVNTSNSIVSAANTGGTRALDLNGESNDVAPSGSNEEDMPRMGHPAADAYSSNPPPFDRKKPRAADGPLASSVSYGVGATKNFWVESAFGSNAFIQRTATLVAQGTYGNIWVIDNLITTDQAQKLSEKFDTIYPAETNLLGYEYGGGLPPSDPAYGGYDGDPRIQILVYNIGSGSGSSATLGYFWGKDMRYDTGSGQRSNEAEMFYLNSYGFSVFSPDVIYSTLIHEFQHMINFSRKTVKLFITSATWYNEMLSMMAEDVISPIIGITASNQAHPITQRIPGFLNCYYAAGITDWGASADILNSYSIAYAYGAYLLRNYGGPRLLKEILDNNSTNINSITAALKTVAGGGLDFNKALQRYGEAIIYSGAKKPYGKLTFDTTVINTINSFTYTAYGFDIWTMARTGGGTGPYILGLDPVALRPYSISVHQTNEWKNVSGNFTVTLDGPLDPHVSLYMLVK